MKPRSKWLPFLFLNIIISALTTLLVLFFWNRAHPTQQINLPANLDPIANAQPQPTVTLPANDIQLIKIVNVIGAGNLDNEYLVLERVGEGALSLTSWKLMDDDGNEFIFPEIELIQGQLEIYSHSGVNTVNKLFWNASEAVWKSGETVHLVDYQNQERASFIIP